MTMNVAKILAHPSFSKSVVPALEDALKKVSTTGNDATKADAFLKDTGINAKSFTDVAMCVKDTDGSKPSISAAFAGDIKADSIVPAIEKADASVSSKVKDIDGRKAISDADVTLGQLSDGTIAIGSSDALFGAQRDGRQRRCQVQARHRQRAGVQRVRVAHQKAMSKRQHPRAEVGEDRQRRARSRRRQAQHPRWHRQRPTPKLESLFNLMKTELGSKMAGAPRARPTR
jgi:hypothetical protein